MPEDGELTPQQILDSALPECVVGEIIRTINEGDQTKVDCCQGTSIAGYTDRQACCPLTHKALPKTCLLYYRGSLTVPSEQEAPSAPITLENTL